MGSLLPPGTLSNRRRQSWRNLQPFRRPSWRNLQMLDIIAELIGRPSWRSRWRPSWRNHQGLVQREEVLGVASQTETLQTRTTRAYSDRSWARDLWALVRPSASNQAASGNPFTTAQAFVPQVDGVPINAERLQTIYRQLSRKAYGDSSKQTWTTRASSRGLHAEELWSARSHHRS